jgi:phage tail sheath gpL-like
MTITPTSKAAIKAVGFRNEAFSVGGGAIARKINIIGTYDPALTEVVPDEPVRVFSPEDGGDKFGFGYMIHRLLLWLYRGSQGIETWVTPQAEAGGAAASTGDIDFATSSVTKAGTLAFYAAGWRIPTNLIVGDDGDSIAIAFAAAINADSDAPITAEVNVGVSSQVDITAKSKGPWGDDITLAFNLGFGEELPDGVAQATTPMSGGSGIPDVQDALDAWGTGDQQNDDWFTDVVCGYGQDSSTLNKISAYNGLANDATGNYAKEVGRPFRALVGDTVADSAGLTALIALGDARAETDMTNGVIAEPGSYHHPMEIAALAMGVMARTNSIRAEEGYIDRALPGLIPSPLSTRWTNDYDNRDIAVKAGISPTKVVKNVVYFQNMLTFYRPASLPIDSNFYRSQRNISVNQSMWSLHTTYFDREYWKGFTVVQDKARVTNLLSQEKVRDSDDLMDALIFLAYEYEKNAWLYSADYTIQQLKSDPTLIRIREDGSGWDYTMPGIVSGEGGILNGLVKLDASFAVLAN